ncbi:MAG: hypothetical protein KGR26_01545 [Cyanobacteria bacterium REEB65]|nr:hypothetical protein [Cyanobacteria bacterium REEB65]
MPIRDHRLFMLDPTTDDLDPISDPVLLWAGKRPSLEIPKFPLQRTEVVAASRIEPIARRTLGKAAAGKITTHSHGEWRNKLVCGDSLLAMQALLEHDRLGGGVQAVYFDPPYGIQYDANFQTRIDVPHNADGKAAEDVVSIQAFRDTWVLGIHSYLTYLRDRLYLCRELLAESGSVFVQSGDRNVHLVRNVLDEVFGAANGVSLIPFRKKTMPLGARYLDGMVDYLIWYAKDLDCLKFNQLYVPTAIGGDFHWKWFEDARGQEIAMTPSQRADSALLPKGARPFRLVSMKAPGYSAANDYPVEFAGRTFRPPKGGSWITGQQGMARLAAANRLFVEGRTLTFKLFHDDFPWAKLTNLWGDTVGAFDKSYVVQTNEAVVRRCLLMATDPGDLVFDPTCGSGTTAVCAERWGRRWIACDTSRVAIHVARKRLLSTPFEAFVLKGESPGDGLELDSCDRVTLRTLAGGLPPERISLVDRPVVRKGVVRVSAPFEILAIARYATDAWDGYVTGPDGQLDNYIDTLCRLYAPDVVLEGFGLVHGVVERPDSRFALSIGPLSGRVTAMQVAGAAKDALALGFRELHVLGWSFEPDLGQDGDRLGASVRLVAIRPDSLIEGLAVQDGAGLFSPLASPKIALSRKGASRWIVTLEEVQVFDRQRAELAVYPANSGYVAAWYLDQDYDGDCFVDDQVFFDFSRGPSLKAALRVDIPDADLRLQLTSQPFGSPRGGRVAVRVVDVYGNESTVVRTV